MNIILCGLPKSGKTTLGILLAKKLNRVLIDTDVLIQTAYETMTGQILSCREIFVKEGEAFFRSLETRQLRSLQKTTNAVIALGGGSLVPEENQHVLKPIGLFVYLEIDPNTLWKRIQSTENTTPAYLDEYNVEQSFYHLATSRIPTYKQTADIQLNVETLSPETILDVLLNKLKVFDGKQLFWTAI